MKFPASYLALWDDIENSRRYVIETLYIRMYPLDAELIQYSSLDILMT